MITTTPDFGRIVHDVHLIKKINFDLGSKAVKIAYTTDVKITRTTLSQEIQETGASFERLHCIQVPYADFPAVLAFISNNSKMLKGTVSHFSYTSRLEHIETMIEEMLGVTLHLEDTFGCLTRGTTFLLRNIEAESYTYSFDDTKQEYEFQTLHDNTIFPYILVNIRTGISVIRVDSETEFTRIGGSSIGGGCFLGLSMLLTGEEDLEKLMNMAADGDPTEFDMHISDVYGDKNTLFGLESTLLAASFAKASGKGEEGNPANNSEQSKKNMVISLIRMILYNVGQIAYMYSSTNQIDRVFFNGFLVRNRPIVMKTLSYACNYWSGGKLRPYFLRHENYTTAIGAFLNSGNANVKNYWKEHYSGSTALGRFVPFAPLETGFKAQIFELNCTGFVGQPFSLLTDKDIKPDTIDFNQDPEARQFWLQVMHDTIAGYSKTAQESQKNSGNDEKVAARAESFSEVFRNMMKVIMEHPVAYGNSNARNILELREQCLQEHNFDDIYLKIKREENTFALSQLQKVLNDIDEIRNTKSHEEFFEYVCRGILAGNVFDWGAKEVVKMMGSSDGLSFTQAIQAVEARPWLFDSFDEFHQNYKSYKSILIFVDNSGCDYILGVLPFAREFLRLGAKVIICANTSPALNDLTYGEMVELVPEIAEVNDELGGYLDSDQLSFVQTGQESPCLDARRVHVDLNEVVAKHKTDLVVIEGMGRALHTNFNVNFTVDTLKVAVIKTQWLADRLDGKMFSVVFKYEKGMETKENTVE